MTVFFYTLGLILLLGVWMISGIVILSYSRLKGPLKYVQAVCTLPLVFVLVTAGILLSARLVRESMAWFDGLPGPAWRVLLSVLVSFVLVVPLIAGLIWGWFRLLGFIERRLGS